jgi:hypothetical protein
LAGNALQRNKSWSEAIAVGGPEFVSRMKRELGTAAQHREVEEVDGMYALRESGFPYRASFDAKIGPLRSENTRF